MTKATDMLFTLLRLSLNTDKNSLEAALSVFVDAREDDWEDLFKLSIRQGTVLLAYGGIQYLPAKLEPPRKLKLRWCVNVVKGSERYDSYKRVITKFSNLLSENGIDTLINKGVTLSELYPVPSYREGGDVDVYLFGKSREAGKLIAALGIEEIDTVPKHSAFTLGGLTIENHHTFFDTTLRFEKERDLYQKMESMLQGMFTEETCPKINLGTARRLPPQAAALYFIGHTFRHFCCLDINIRQMCDWTVFFTRYEKEIDSDLLSSQIEELGLQKFVSHINFFCSKHLGFKPYFTTLPLPNTKAEQYIFKIITDYRLENKRHIPAIDPLCYLFGRNNIYKKYMGNVKTTDFLLPEIKSYFSYLIKK